MNKIAIASDHKGFNLKTKVKSLLESLSYKVIDCGTDSGDVSVDYPDYAKLVCEQILENSIKMGILICGTGIGMAICANRLSKIRAAQCHNQYMAFKARSHNDANILVLGSKIITPLEAEDIVKTFLTTGFEGGRHIKRLEKIH